MSKFYKTVRGEVYGKCGITFGAEPVEVSDAKLKEVGGTLKMSVADRLAADRRLVEVDPPASVTNDDGDGDPEPDASKASTGTGKAATKKK